MLAGTEFVRLLGALQQNNPVGRERIRSHLVLTAKCNLITLTQNVTGP